MGFPVVMMRRPAALVPGSLWSWGSYINGALGDNALADRSTPVQVGSDETWTMVAGGYDFAIFLKADGTIWSVGLNDVGQLGQGDTTTRTTITQIGSSTDWVEVFAGTTSAGARNSSGQVYVWGSGANYKLGLGGTGNQTSPQLLGTYEKVRFMAQGGLAVGNGILWVWGQSSSVTPNLGVKIANFHLGESQISQTNTITGGTTGDTAMVDRITVTSGAWADNDAAGQIWTWDDDGALGFSSSEAINVGGTLKAYFSQRPLPPTTSGGLYDTPTQMSRVYTSWTDIADGSIPPNSGAAIASGTMRAWGYNESGQLGQADALNKYSPQTVSGAWLDATWAGNLTDSKKTTLIGIKTDGTLWACGEAGSGQTGQNSLTDISSMAQIGSATNWVSVHGGDRYFLALNSDGELWACGEGADGRQGDGAVTDNLVITQITALSDIVSISAGGRTAYAIKRA